MYPIIRQFTPRHITREIKMYVYKKTCTLTSTVAVFIIAPNWTQPKCPPTGEWISNELLRYATTWMKFKHTLSKNYQHKRAHCVISFIRCSRIGQTDLWWNQSEQWMPGGGAWIEKGHKGTFWGNENGLSFDRGVDDTGVYICQDSWNVILKIHTF